MASPPLQALADRFAFNDGFLDQLTDGFTAADWLARQGEANHAQWLLGHLASTRSWAARELGSKRPAETWEPLFSMKSKSTSESDAVPVTTLRDTFRSRGVEMRATLATVTPEQAATDFRPFPWGTKDLSGAMHFLHFHESYHLGQIGLIRRMAGRPGLV